MMLSGISAFSAFNLHTLKNRVSWQGSHFKLKPLSG
jgi:hypothetical protein